MTDTLTATGDPSPSRPTDDDVQLLESARRRFAAAVGEGAPLFTTDISDLWSLFVESIPEAQRKEYACYACRTFVSRYGALATIDENGNLASALWGESSGIFAQATGRLADAVDRARPTGVFFSNLSTWGTPVTEPWEHLAVSPPESMIFRHALRTPRQEMAEKREAHAALCRALEDFSVEVARNARQLLAAGDSLYRAEKVLGVAEWFLALHERRDATRNGRSKENLVWRAVATAPAGFSHIRSAMIGTLLEDLARGLDFAEIKERFDAKMHPLQYMRPTAGPSAGQIVEAEKAVAALAAAGSLDRRFARLEDVEAIWQPEAPTALPSNVAGEAGVFGSLKAAVRGRKEPQAVEAPAVTITWEKFARTVLPEAIEMEVYVPAANRSYIALTTASNVSAPPILQWDREERRNPVSWYVYLNGSPPRDFNLAPDSYYRVTTLTLLPPMWGLDVPRPHWGQGVIFLLEGARDLKTSGGIGFFPEQLRAEFHAFRKTFEAFAKSTTVADQNEATACGLDLRKGGNWHNALIRVTSKSGRSSYQLDRWD
ncbi:MAG: hypothetical protein ABJC13_13395 [Acidobacteriota bacterium]